MSTVTLHSHTTPTRAIFRRFLWKEYRMLRGFWLAVGALAVVAQLVMPQLAFNIQNTSGQWLAIAWGAAALYAIGATITLFSAEQEEETRDFLSLLPGHWLPMFLAKTLLALLSAAGLALALSLTGWLFSGGNMPTSAETNLTLGVVGIAVVEATVWGLLFSLSMRQPLLAAILAIAAASFGAQLAVSMTVHSSVTFAAASYLRAVPMRLLICAGVFLLDLWLALRWLNPTLDMRQGLRRPQAEGSVRAVGATSVVTSMTKGNARPSRRRMLMRLLWQTWRESWATMLAVVPIALLLMGAIFMFTWLSDYTFLSVIACPLLLPALFGALVFRADQRQGHREFLVAHAGRPRYVWLVRQAVWLSTLMLLVLLVQIGVSLLVMTSQQDHFVDILYSQNIYFEQTQSVWASWHLGDTIGLYIQITQLGWCAVLSAYGLGQLCSMMLRREVLAGFLALLSATVLSAWALAIGFWQLNPLWFVLPVGLCALFATWLRTPNWMVNRNSPRAWTAPLLAMILPLGWIVTTLPQARLNQLPTETLSEGDLALDHNQRRYHFLYEPVSASLQTHETDLAAEQETALQYERLEASLEVKEEVAEFEFSSPLTSKELHAYAESNQAAIAELEDLSRRPYPASTTLDEEDLGPRSPQGIHKSLINLVLFGTIDKDLETSRQRLLCAVRMEGQVFMKKPTTWYGIFSGYNYGDKGSVHSSLLRWAQRSDQTSENLKTFIADLQEIYTNYPEPREAVLTDYYRIRDILLERQPPKFMSQEKIRFTQYLLYAANHLSWERQRALRALELLTNERLNLADAVSSAVRGEGMWSQNPLEDSRQLHNFFWSLNRTGSETEGNQLLYGRLWNFQQVKEVTQQARTSYLVAEELSYRSSGWDLIWSDFLPRWVDAKIAQRGLITQLALLAYEIDHGQYPETLEELVPDYLTELPLDPYSRQPFVYRPAGLELELSSVGIRWNENIAAGTPLFWSVGGDNAELRRVNVSEHDNSETKEEEVGNQEPHWVYELTPTRWTGRRNNKQAFPLPPLPPASPLQRAGPAKSTTRPTQDPSPPPLKNSK